MSNSTRSMNRRVVLARRPTGMPTVSDFRLEESPLPTLEPGYVLLQTQYLSLDPYMRQLMDEIGPAYAPSIELNATMAGATVSQVVESQHPGFKIGDMVLHQSGWQQYAISDGLDLVPLGRTVQPSYALGILGMPGFTAHFGLLDIGQPKANDTVVVSAATGAVGSVVGQIAKVRGLRVVGIAGGADKCRYAVDEMKFDACIDRHDALFPQALAAACPDGVDVYFENVGGSVLSAVVPLLNIGSRVVVCGAVAHYNDRTAPSDSRTLTSLLTTLVQKRVRMEGFVILDHYGERFEVFRCDIEQWLLSGQVTYREDVTVGLENAPAAFIRMLEGRNFGKSVVAVVP